MSAIVDASSAWCGDLQWQALGREDVVVGACRLPSRVLESMGEKLLRRLRDFGSHFDASQNQTDARQDSLLGLKERLIYAPSIGSGSPVTRQISSFQSQAARLKPSRACSCISQKPAT